MSLQVPSRAEIEKRYTWNAESVFPTPADWEAEWQAIDADLPQITAFQGRLAEGPETLHAALQTAEELGARLMRVFLYASMSFSVDTTDQQAAAMLGKARALGSRFAAASAFLEPEMLALGHETLLSWTETYQPLAIYRHHFENLLRGAEHVRSAEVEEVLGMLGEVFSGPSTVASMLTNADLRFEPAVDAEGNKLEVTSGSLGKILAMPDREARRTAWEHYMDGHLAFKNTLASNLATGIQQDVFRARVRRHASSLEASLFRSNIPVEVFHNLLETFRRHLPVWQRYFDLRQRALGVETLYPYDMWAPLAPTQPQIPYEEAVELICAGLQPLGEEYVATMRRGCLEQRWVDVYPNKGKRSGAFSTGAPGTYPFIMMSYTDTIFSLSTLAHELGHSMHSWLTRHNQPLVYSRYSLFVAEVASNFHQAMVRDYLLREKQERDFQIAVLEEAMANFYRYFFIMPTLARFELELHQRAERGQPLTAAGMIGLMADLFAEGYGDTVAIDRERLGMTWATFPHMFMNFYVYQYATGISGAHSLAGRILRGEAGAVDDYLGFLKAGSSQYPLDVLRAAGVDLTRPEPVEETFALMASYIDRLESLLNA